MKPLEQGKFKRIRSELLKRANGKVLELGSGTGINFPFYNGVEVTAIEPSEYMLNRSLKRREQAKVPIELIQSGAEHLPFDDHTFDTVVATLVFCTIPDVHQAMVEMKRVCKPGGKILMFEHVKMDHPFLARLQESLTPYWKKVCDGCCLNRETEQLIKKHGFKVIETKEFYRGLFITMVLNKEK